MTLRARTIRHASTTAAEDTVTVVAIAAATDFL